MQDATAERSAIEGVSAIVDQHPSSIIRSTPKRGEERYYIVNLIALCAQNLCIVLSARRHLAPAGQHWSLSYWYRLTHVSRREKDSVKSLSLLELLLSRPSHDYYVWCTPYMTKGESIHPSTRMPSIFFTRYYTTSKLIAILSWIHFQCVWSWSCCVGETSSIGNNIQSHAIEKKRLARWLLETASPPLRKMQLVGNYRQ